MCLAIGTAINLKALLTPSAIEIKRTGIIWPPTHSGRGARRQEAGLGGTCAWASSPPCPAGWPFLCLGSKVCVAWGLGASCSDRPLEQKMEWSQVVGFCGNRVQASALRQEGPHMKLCATEGRRTPSASEGRACFGKGLESWPLAGPMVFRSPSTSATICFLEPRGWCLSTYSCFSPCSFP